jgi:hypothetical protein
MIRVARREYFNSVGNAVRNSYGVVSAVLLLGGTLMSGPCDPVAQFLRMPHRGNYDPVELGLFYGAVAFSSLCLAYEGIVKPILRDRAITRGAESEQFRMERPKEIQVRILGEKKMIENRYGLLPEDLEFITEIRGESFRVGRRSPAPQIPSIRLDVRCADEVIKTYSEEYRKFREELEGNNDGH